MAGRPGRSGGHNRRSRQDHLVAGTFSKTRHARLGDAVTAPAGDIVKPGTLSKGAATVWDALAPVCTAMHTLTPADVWSFATLCELQASFTAHAQRKDRLMDASRELKTAGSLRSYYALFGLEPQARSRLTTPLPAPATNPLDKFINRSRWDALK